MTARPRVLVTGGTGRLGRRLVPRLVAGGWQVRVMSRRPGGATWATDALEWVRADLATGDGIAAAVAGCEAVVHAASSPFRRTRAVDVTGTERLLQAAGTARVSHLLYVSITGAERLPLPYYRAKVAVERRVRASSIPWTVVRITQFYEFVDFVLGQAARLPALVLPHLLLQPVDEDEAAEHVLRCLHAGPSGQVAEMGGPEPRSLADLAQSWLQRRGLRRPLVPMPLPVRAWHRALVPADSGPRGRVRWEQWLERTYGPGP